YPLHPHLREQIGRMWIGGSSKIARTAEVLLRVQAGLFGSGSAGLGYRRSRSTSDAIPSPTRSELEGAEPGIMRRRGERIRGEEAKLRAELEERAKEAAENPTLPRS